MSANKTYLLRNCTDYYSINFLYPYSQSEAKKFLINVKVINYVYRFMDNFFPCFSCLDTVWCSHFWDQPGCQALRYLFTWLVTAVFTPVWYRTAQSYFLLLEKNKDLTYPAQVWSIL